MTSLFILSLTSLNRLFKSSLAFFYATVTAYFIALNFSLIYFDRRFFDEAIFYTICVLNYEFFIMVYRDWYCDKFNTFFRCFSYSNYLFVSLSIFEVSSIVFRLWSLWEPKTAHKAHSLVKSVRQIISIYLLCVWHILLLSCWPWWWCWWWLLLLISDESLLWTKSEEEIYDDNCLLASEGWLRTALLGIDFYDPAVDFLNAASFINLINEIFLGKYYKSASTTSYWFPQYEHSIFLCTFLKTLFKQFVQTEWSHDGIIRGKFPSSNVLLQRQHLSIVLVGIFFIILYL